MSEGELKKRIGEKRFLFNPKKCQSGRKVLYAYDVYALLDEARKEFPKKHEPSDWRGNKPPATYDEEEVDAWVLKYFGQKKE